MSVNDRARLYFEGHITLAPVQGSSLVALETLAKQWNFRISTFLMVKEGQNEPDAFISVRDESYARIVIRMAHAVTILRSMHYEVKRVKIEDTVYDTKHGDPEL